MTKTAKIGHNNPPDEFAEITVEINDLYQTAKDFNDGDPITTQKQSDSVAKIVKLLKIAAKRAEAHRKELVIPIDEAKQAVQDMFNPLIGKAKADGSRGLTVRAIGVCTQLLTPWNVKLQAEKDKAAEEAREKAEEQLCAAQEANRSANLVEREDAETLIKAAQKAQFKAKAMSKDKVLGMKTVWDIIVRDPNKLLKHYYATQRRELEEFAGQLAQQEINSGVRKIPGCIITSRSIAK